MKMRVTIEFDVEECLPGDADIDSLHRLADLSASELEDRVTNGFYNLLGSHEKEYLDQLDAMMFDGEDHLLVCRNIHVFGVHIIKQETTANEQ